MTTSPRTELELEAIDPHVVATGLSSEMGLFVRHQVGPPGKVRPGELARLTVRSRALPCPISVDVHVVARRTGSAPTGGGAVDGVMVRAATPNDEGLRALSLSSARAAPSEYVRHVTFAAEHERTRVLWQLAEGEEVVLELHAPATRGETMKVSLETAARPPVQLELKVHGVVHLDDGYACRAAAEGVAGHKAVTRALHDAVGDAARVVAAEQVRSTQR